MKRRTSYSLAILGTGSLIFGAASQCANLAFDGLSGATDFCFLFDCTDGLFNGLIDPCQDVFSRPSNPGTIAADGGATGTTAPNSRLFGDCPDDEP